jgi:hypothetical protein
VEVTDNVINVQKSMVVPIRCSKVNVEATLREFPTTHSPLPIRYLVFRFWCTILEVWTFNSLWINWQSNYQ